MDSFKVCQLNYSDTIGGASRAAFRLNQALAENNVYSRMLVQRKQSQCKNVSEFGSRASIVGAQIKYAVSRRMIRYLSFNQLEGGSLNFGFFSSLPQKIEDYDLIHLHWLGADFISLPKIRSLLLRKCVWTFHDLWPSLGVRHYPDTNSIIYPNFHKEIFIERLASVYKKFYLSNPFQIIAPSHWMRDCIHGISYFNDCPVTVIPNGIDCEFWRPIDQQTARARLNIPSDKIVICVGGDRFMSDRRKGAHVFHEFIYYLSSLDIKNDIHLIFFGEPSCTDISQFGMSVSSFGVVSNDYQLRDIYSASNVVAVLSVLDNLPNVVLEASACGLPVVAFDTGGISDLVVHEKTGYLARPFDAQEFVQGIHYITKSLNTMDFSKNAREFIQDNFSYPVIARAHQNLYSKVMDH